MRRSLCLLKLCLLCAALSRGVAIPLAAERATPRPPDAGSTNDDRMVEKQPPASTTTTLDLSTELTQNQLNVTRSLLQSDAWQHDDASGFNCELTDMAVGRYTSADKKTWLVDDEVLKEIDNDLQMIINCTQEGDVVSFNATDVIKPSSLVTIPWQLTISSYTKDNSGRHDYRRSKTRTIFKCPQENTGLFLVQATDVTFADLVIKGCTFDGTEGARALIEVSGCEAKNGARLVALHRVTFRKNTLISASGLRMSESSCSDLEMVEVEIANNVCSSDGCGVLLSKKSNLENCAAFENRVVKSNKQMSSLLYVPALSSTTIQGLEASRNDLTVIRVREGDLSLSNASFVRNTVDNENAEETKTTCIHLVQSSAAISKCSFTANNGYNGSAVLAKESDVSVSTSVFNNNLGSRSGGCVHALMSNVTLEKTSATNNSAERDGGFMHVLSSNVTLENTSAANNIAKDDGGFLYAKDSTIALENTTATNSSTESVGGFLYAQESTAKLENTLATNSSAENSGGFLYAKDSTIALEKTTATDSSVKVDGGFMVAWRSNVTLKNTSAVNSNAKDYGGFLYARESTAKLENTLAIYSSAGNSGGFLYAKDSTIALEKTTATNSSVKVDGGFMVAWRSNVTLKNISSVNSSAANDGGFVYALISTVTLENASATNSSAGNSGGFLYAKDSTIALENTTATNSSTESLGGFMYARESTAKLENTLATNSSAGNSGGFLYAAGSNITLENTTATNSSVKADGGFMVAWRSNVTLKNISSVNSSAANDGGFVYALISNVTLENASATSSRSEDDGGFVCAEDSNITMANINAVNSNAKDYGGFLYARESTAKLENTLATNSSSENSGGFLYAEDSKLTVHNTTAISNNAEHAGGSLYLLNSNLRITLSQFSSSNSNTSGGFAAMDSSSIFMNDTEIVGGRSKNGGAIWLKASNTTARNLSIIHCRADNSGGGVMSRAHSTFLCTDCKFESNSAEKGNGGAIFFDSHPNQTLALQIAQSRFENNEADFGGGLFFVCSKKNDRCSTNGTDCPFMALTGTKLSGNNAKVAGGAVFVGYLEAVRFDCSVPSWDSRLKFYEEEKWKDLKRMESIDDFCSGWKNNSGSVYGPVIGTYAVAARMTLEDTSSVCVSGSEDCVLAEYRNGTDLPAATVTLVDGFMQGPSRNYRAVQATLSSPSNEFLVGSVVLPMKDGTCTFRSIRGFVPQGEYKLTVDFSETAIQEIGLTVKVQNCSFGEVLLLAKFCVDCSSTSFNFDPSAEECQPCPEHGNCESRAITPEDGYWQKTPCSDHIYKCLPASACKFKGRSKKLTDLVSNVTSCHFNETWIEEDYTKTQCAKGHEGPRCGSCSRRYGSGLSAKCRKCSKGFVNIALILTSVLFLMGLTGITVNGTLNVRETNPGELRRQNALTTRSTELGPVTSLEDQAERANTNRPSHRRDSLGDQSIEGVPADDVLLAKWKAVEMFKIILGFIQTTILLASLDVGWGLPLFILAEAAEYISGLASDGNRRSVMCLDLKDPYVHPTALAFAFNVFFVPVAVFVFWMAFWMIMAVRYGNDRPPRCLAKRCMLSLMALWYITLVPVLKTTLSIGLCVDVEDSSNAYAGDLTTKYWALDTSIQCYQGDHANLLYFTVGAFVCPMYGGLLIVFALFLRASEKHLCDKDGWIYGTTGFLYRSYSLGRRRYWEVAVVLRKVAVSFLVFCAHLYDSVVPITGVAHVITLAIAAQIVVKPYRKEFKDLNRFEVASLIISQATTHVAIMLRQEDFPKDIVRELFTVACVLLSLITFFVFVFYLLKFAADYLRHGLIERGEDTVSNAGMFGVLRQWIGYEIKRLIPNLRSTPKDPETAEQLAFEGRTE